jgi:hypothetical protein
MLDRKFTPRDTYFAKANCLWYDEQFRKLTGKCANPQCGFPLPEKTDPPKNYYSSEFGAAVCDLCHDMECAARRQPGLAAAHDAWKKEQQEKKRIIERN